MTEAESSTSSSSAQRQLLLAAATREFAANGFAETSIQQVASTAQVSKAKVFYYFETKNDLYAQVLDQTLEPLLARLQSRQQSGSAESFWRSLESGLGFAFEFARRDPHAAALLRDLYQREGNAESLERLLARARAAIVGWLRDGQQLGAVRTDLSLSVLAEATVGALVRVDRWLASQTDREGGATEHMSSSSLAALARDALQQRIPAECEAQVDYAAEHAPREADAYLDVAGTTTRSISLRNARDAAHAVRFEREGFELFESPTVFAAAPDDSESRAAYGAVETALATRLGASFVRVFDHTIRHTEGTPGARRPIRVVHADYGQDAGHRRLREVLSHDEAERWATSRIVVANLWQSVAGVVHSTPLAFVDVATVADADFIPVTIRYPDREGEIGYYRPNDDHRWYWFPFLLPSESLLFKTFDGRPSGQHWSCPHAAFTSPFSPEALAGRRTSIEFRILLAFEGDEQRVT